MRINDCQKGYYKGISKVFPPGRTCGIVLKRFRNVVPPILNGYFEITQPSKIPQYRIIGSPHYQQVVRNEGSNGKGHIHEQALASGLMELAERYSCFKYLRNRDAVKKGFKNGLFRLEDVFSNCTNGPYVRILDDEELRKAGIRWSEGYTLNNEKVSLPMNLIVFLVEGSNGMAAGNTLEEALLQGICEVIERHCLILIEQNKIRTPLIDPSTINSAIAKGLIKRFTALRQEVLIKDFSLDVGVPVIGVARKIDKNACIVTAGVATTREEALIRALTENSQTEYKLNFQKVSACQHYFAFDKTISLKDIPNVDNRNLRRELENLEGILHKQNMRVFYIDATDKALNVPSVIVYIAGAKHFNPEMAHRNVLMGLIEECLETNDCVGADRYVKMGLRIDRKNNVIYSYYQGTILMREKKYRKAMRFFRSVLKNRSIIGDFKKLSLVKLGLCHQAVKEINRAIKCYTKTIDLYPQFRIDHINDFYLSERLKLPRERELLKRAKELYQQLLLIETNFVDSDLYKNCSQNLKTQKS